MPLIYQNNVVLRLAHAPSQALDWKQPRTVTVTNFVGRLSQIWSRMGVDNPETYKPIAPQLPSTTSSPENYAPPTVQNTEYPVIDVPATVDRLNDTIEFRGCLFPPVARS